MVGGGASRREFLRLRIVLVLHLVALVAMRLFTDADDFNNWDLISFQNANSFASLSALLAQPEVHLFNPFSFPVYNTGAESVLSILMHRAMSGVSLYWSNTAVLVVYDAMFLTVLAALLRLVFVDGFLLAASWILVAMSPVLLTFASVSAFDMQAFATITLALLGCERILQSMPRSGLAMLVVAFACISQAYPLTFFLPVFCLVWTGARVAMGWGEDGRDMRIRSAAAVVAAVVACVAVVELGSGGEYLGKTFWVVADPLSSEKVDAPLALSSRVAAFLRESFVPVNDEGLRTLGFAPYFVWLGALLVAASAVVAARGSQRNQDAAPRNATAGRGAGWLAALAWVGLVAFGYMPALFGNNLKSQRCFFGDLFLAMAVVAAIGALVRRRAVGRRTILATLLALMLAADATYVAAVLGEDHRYVHYPVFDFDLADGRARHDLDGTVDVMRTQMEEEDAPLIVYYPRGQNENTTDPAMFYARFLRRAGSYHRREELIFPCHFCSLRYGCAFPDVGRRRCRGGCCYRDPLAILDERPRLAGRRIYLWWFTDAGLEDEPRQSQMLASLGRRYVVTDMGYPAPEKRWRCFALDPRKGQRSGGRTAAPTKSRALGPR